MKIEVYIPPTAEKTYTITLTEGEMKLLATAGNLGPEAFRKSSMVMYYGVDPNAYLAFAEMMTDIEGKVMESPRHSDKAISGNELNGKKHCDLCDTYHRYL